MKYKKSIGDEEYEGVEQKPGCGYSFTITYFILVDSEDEKCITYQMELKDVVFMNVKNAAADSWI